MASSVSLAPAAADARSPRGSSRELLLDLGAVVLGWSAAAALLALLTGGFQPLHAALCGVLGGVVSRRLLRPSWQLFPLYLRRVFAGGVVLFGTLLAVWAVLAVEPWPAWAHRWQATSVLYAFTSLLGVALVALHYTHRRLAREVEAARERAVELRETTLRAQLAALQAQIQPHFLFNALNALAELAHEDPDGAERTAEDLAHLLRYSLRSSAERLVPLSEELEAVERYLRVERARLGERLRVERDVDPSAGDELVPGLLLQPLVENAIRHAIAPREGGGVVRIAVGRRGGALVLAVEDDGPGIPEEIRRRLASSRPERPDAAGTGGAGGGLANVLRRCELVFRHRATVRVGASELGGASVCVEIAR